MNLCKIQNPSDSTTALLLNNITSQADRGGEEDHVAIPTVTYTNNLMYHLKAEKALFFNILNPIASMD
ncbi:MAG: hypothetical protein GXO97_08240 [Nitrospirae bacterium]|nr:hypothetical protein [Nitrospirota bacterium]